MTSIIVEMTGKRSDITKKLGWKIKIERTKKKLSQEALAELANLNRNSISAIERCESSPTIETLGAIAKALDIKLTDLVDIDKIDF